MPKPRNTSVITIGNADPEPFAARRVIAIPPDTAHAPRIRRRDRYQAFILYSCRVIADWSEMLILILIFGSTAARKLRFTSIAASNGDAKRGSKPLHPSHTLKCSPHCNARYAAQPGE